MLRDNRTNTDTGSALKAEMQMRRPAHGTAGTRPAARILSFLAAALPVTTLCLSATPTAAAAREVLQLPAACTAGRVAPFERHTLSGPDRLGEFADAGGHVFTQADLVPLGEAVQASRDMRPLHFHDMAGRPDRWNRRSGLLVDARDGAWLALEAVREGAAAVLPEQLSPECLAPLLAAENSARHSGRGAWRRHRAHAASDPDAIARLTGRFALVEGPVVSVGETRSTLYLNFGYRWRDDFTVTISASRREEFEAAGLDVAALEGAAIRVRGIVQTRDGPLIKVSHPAQIERLDKDGMRR